jgi:glycosyltransferase involved in cell wall biosynthesis
VEGHPKVTILCLGNVGVQMASPAIRGYELGRVLRDAGAEVRLMATELEGAEGLELPCEPFHRHGRLGRRLRDADIVIAQPQWPLVMRDLRRSGAILIFDLYYPDALEKLEHTVGQPRRLRDIRIAMTVDRFNEAARIGHHFICASEIQRDMWLGTMLAQGLIRPQLYDRDPSLRSVIDVVPFGLPEQPPTAGGDPWTRLAGVNEGDEIVLWNGGIWPWLDAPTAVRAIGELSRRRPSAKLVFMAPPNDETSRDAGERARSLAGDLGLLDRSVFFNDVRVPYAERGPWMLSASCALHCHGPALETRFAFRTRVLDCYWAGLPVVTTGGDTLADEIERDGLGAVAAQGDHVAVAAALEQVLERGKQNYAEALGHAADRYLWDKVAQPLVHLALEAPLLPRTGEGIRRRPAQQLRTAAYCAARGVLNTFRMRGWPGQAA